MTQDRVFPNSSSSNKKSCGSSSGFPKKKFPTTTKNPHSVQQQRIPLVNYCIFFKRKKDPHQAFQKDLLQTKKNCASLAWTGFPKNPFLTKRKVPTWCSAMTATVSSAG